MRVALIGEPALLSLHGAEGTFAWGELRRMRSGDDTVLADFGPEVVIALGDAPAAAGAAPHATWREHHADADADADAGGAGVRVIAPAGDGLWRRAPLPAADDLFSAPRDRGAGVLVVGPDAEARAAASERLRAQGLVARACARPLPAALASAAVVVVLGEAGAPMPAVAFAALASGRLVLAPPAAPAFGMAAGVDHLPYAQPDELAELAEVLLRHPAAFATMAAMGRITAEAARASASYGRVASDLAAA